MLLEVPPLLEVLPLRGLVPLGETQAGTTSRLRPATIPSHSHRFPLQLNFGTKVTRSHQRVKSFDTRTRSAPGPVPTALKLIHGEFG